MIRTARGGLPFLILIKKIEFQLPRDQGWPRLYYIILNHIYVLKNLTHLPPTCLGNQKYVNCILNTWVFLSVATLESQVKNHQDNKTLYKPE